MNLPNKTRFWWLIGAAVVAAFWWWPKNKNNLTGVEINGLVIPVETAVLPGERMRGLSGRDKLDKETGMLFFFSRAGKHPFWMNGMNFDLDFIFIKDGIVVEVVENVPAPQAREIPATITSTVAADRILEVNAGFVAGHKIKVGDKVKYQP